MLRSSTNRPDGEYSSRTSEGASAENRALPLATILKSDGWAWVEETRNDATHKSNNAATGAAIRLTGLLSWWLAGMA
jgi:hypothetical protein